MPNRLVNETSPYLLQHADNPVDWYTWGEEPFRRAREEDKPVLLSVGYSSCHWCHVMERESFEDDRIATYMNRNFVNVKVDREERPDVDSVYMQALQAMTGHGGWPMTMFLTPDGKPFFGGTYYPSEDREQMPGFPRVLQAVIRAYRNSREDIEKTTQEVVGRLQQMTAVRASRDQLTPDLLDHAAHQIAEGFDREYGGFGEAPKFPQPLILEFLLRYYHRSGESTVLRMVDHTLNEMAQGGIYDQLGGGFHRYSTDPYWLVPHFEKMLYDNALMARLYLHAYLVTERPELRRVVEETVGYVLRDMRDPSGGFYGAQDADSEGVEGAYYVWTPGQVREVLGEGLQADLLERYYGVTREGNFEGRNILSVSRDLKVLAGELGITEEQAREHLDRARRAMLEARARRVPPERDDKVLAAWNGLMLRTLAEAGAALDRDDYLEAARQSASFLLERLRKEGRLMRSHRNGMAHVKGYLEDYACVIDGLLALYEATFEARWLHEAQVEADRMMELFWSEDDGVFYDTGSDQETLVIRPRDFIDNAAPSGSSVACEVLLRLGTLVGKPAYHRTAVEALRSVQGFLSQAPNAFPQWLSALDYYLSTPKEVVIVGPSGDTRTRDMKQAVFGQYFPNKVVTGFDPVDNDVPDIALLEGRDAIDGRATAYVCENFACMMPAQDAATLVEQMRTSMNDLP